MQLSSIQIETEDGIPVLFTIAQTNDDKLVLRIPNLQIQKANIKSDFFKEDFKTDDINLQRLHEGYLSELKMAEGCETCKMSSLRSKYCSILEKLL